MRTLVFSIILLLLINFSVFSQQQIPNGNFENWTGGEPDFWNTLLSVDQTNDAFQGNYAVNMTSQSIFGQFIPGILTLGNIDLTNQTLTGGVPYTDRPDGISFFFKYQPSGADTMFFGAFLTVWNSVDSKTDTIAVTGYFNSNIYNEYTQTDLPFIYTSDLIPDTLNIIFSSSGFNGNAGSSLTVDSIYMKNGSIISPTICFPADEITATSFKTHWLAPPNAISYNLDVSDNPDFSSFISGYENLNVTDTFYTVNNISEGTYYYRVRVNYNSGTSINSNTVEVNATSNGIEQFNQNDIVVSANRNIITVKSTDFYFDEIKLYNIEGKLINEVNKTGNYARFFVKTPGVYISVIKSGNIAIRKKTVVIF